MKLFTFFLFLPLCFAQPALHETVVVTGTYQPLSLDEMDRAVTVLPAREQSILLNTLIDLLELDPSLDLRQRSPGGVQSDLSIRGSSFGQTLVLLNGQRLNDSQSGHHNMDIPVPLESVARVEVLRGSGSTLYGSDAVGGAINIVTEAPEAPEFRLRAALGNFGVNQERGTLTAGTKKLSEQLTFSREFSSGFMADRDYRNLQLASTTHFVSKLGAGNVILAYMDHPFGADQFYGNYNSWEDTKTWFASLDQSLGKNTSVGLTFRRHSDEFVLYRDRPQIFTNHHAVKSWQASLRRHESLGQSATISYGVEGFHDAIDSNNLGDHQRSRAAAYAAIDFRALHRFSLSLSGREEVYRSYSGTFSPTAAGGVWLSRRIKLRASASRAFRVPSYTDLYYHDPANVGSPNLRPERAWTYESGIDWNPGGNWRGDVTVFERRERDGIDYVRRSLTDIWRAANFQNLNFTGVETSLKWTPRSSQVVDFRYTALRGTGDAAAGLYSKYVFNYPAHSGIAAWTGSLGGFVARTRLGVLDRRERDPYAIWDVYGGWSRGRVRPFLQLANVTSTHYQEIVGVVMPGRSVTGGLEWIVSGKQR